MRRKYGIVYVVYDEEKTLRFASEIEEAAKGYQAELYRQAGNADRKIRAVDEDSDACGWVEDQYEIGRADLSGCTKGDVVQVMADGESFDMYYDEIVQCLKESGEPEDYY